MKKALLFAVIIGVLACSLSAFAIVPVKVMINSEELTFSDGDVRAQIIDNSTLIPMRQVFEALDADLKWVYETQTVIATTETGKIITLTVGSDKMSVTDVNTGEIKEVELPVAPRLITAPNKAKFGARVVVPMRAIAESLDMSVDWDGVNYIAYADKK